MDIYRKLSGVRSFSEPSTAVSEITLDQSEESADEEEELDNDVPDEARAPAGQQLRQREHGVDDSKHPVEGRSLDSPDDLDVGHHTSDEEDGTASFSSGGSFDDIGYFSVLSNKGSTLMSPESILTSDLVLGSPPSVMSVSQQGALIRLNQMMTGKILTIEPSLDTSIIDNSTPAEFEQRIAELAGSLGKSVEDASFGSILDALLPLVVEKTNSSFSQPDFGNSEGQVSVDAEFLEDHTLAPDAESADTEIDGKHQNTEAEDENDNDNSSNREADIGEENYGSGEFVTEVGFDSKQLPDALGNSEKEAGDEECQSTEVVVAEGADETPEIAKSAGSVAQAGLVDDDHATNDAAKEEQLPEAPTLVEEDTGVVHGELPDDVQNGVNVNSNSEQVSNTAVKSVDVSTDATGGTDALIGVEIAERKEREQVQNAGANPEQLHESIGFTGAASPVQSEVADHLAEEVPPGRFLTDNDEDIGERRDEVGAILLEGHELQTGRSDADLIPESVEPGGPAPEIEGTDVGETEVKDTLVEELPRTATTDARNKFRHFDNVSRGVISAVLGGTRDSASSTFAGDSGGGDRNFTSEGAVAPSLGASGPSLPVRPSRVARPLRPLETARPVPQPQVSGARAARLSAHSNEALDGEDETREKLQAIKVKFLRLASRLGQSAHHVVVAQVLYRLGLAEQLKGGQSSSQHAPFSFELASARAAKEEAGGSGGLDFSCTIMLLGKTGVGKSATINSIFDEQKAQTNAFQPTTSKVQVITGHVHGIKVSVIDTPGLLPSLADRRHNEKIMASVKGLTKKFYPDIVLYFDRLDMQSRNYGDLPLLRTITETFGASLWFNAIVVLTHASSAPPDGPNGHTLSYEMFVSQRSHALQQTIRQAAGDMRLMNPVALVDNHAGCRMNRSRERVLPNGQVWKPQLLLLCFASKILAEAHSLLQLQDNHQSQAFGTKSKVPPLPFLLSSLLQSRAQLKFPGEPMGDEDASEDETDEDTSDEDEDYDQLPPFRRLAKHEVAELDGDTRSKYYEELAEREKLFRKKQWKEELNRRKELKRRMTESTSDQPQVVDDSMDDDLERSAAIPVPMPDMPLPPSFDSDNPTFRYRYLESANQWIVRPILETNGWDHDNGYDGMSMEKMFAIGNDIPASLSGTITKDKRESNVNIECAASLKLGDGKMTLAGLDIQSVLKNIAYTIRSETNFSNHKRNKTTGGLAVTFLGDTISTGVKIEDRLMVGKKMKFVVSGGAFTGRNDVAYGGSFEVTLKDKDYPLSHNVSTLAVSVMDWHGDLAVGGNLQSQTFLGQTILVGRANLNNRGAGQISIRASSSEQIQMTLIGLLPIIRSLINRFFARQS